MYALTLYACLPCKECGITLFIVIGTICFIDYSLCVRVGCYIMTIYDFFLGTMNLFACYVKIIGLTICVSTCIQ